MNCPDIFQQFDLKPIQLDGELDGQSEQELIGQMVQILSQKHAQQYKGIVYVWSTQRPIPRLRGESNIIYIGQTKKSIHGRYARFKEELADWSLPRYEHIISIYGPIVFFLASSDNPKDGEAQFLKSYYWDHLEAPPFNGTLPDLSP